MITSANICVQSINDDFLQSRGVSLRVVRFDLAHPVVGGNKWYKLQRNLALARDQGVTRVLSFGGAYSNHIYALAAAGAEAGLDTVGIIRGELVMPLNSTLSFARANGMQLVPVSRPDYRRRADPDYIDALRGQYGPCYLIPEGGANEAGVRGCQEMAGVLGALIPDLDGCEIALACGTGTTLAGLVSGLRLLRAHHNAAARPFVRGVAVLKGAGFLRQDIRRWLACVGSSDTDEDWGLETDYHGGGYARADQGLLDFVAQFGRVHDIALEPVYTGKLLHALYQRIGDGHYPAGSRIVMLHTGGLRAGPDGD